MELHKNLLEILNQRNISLATLAKKSGVKQPTLHGWTTGRSVHNLDDLRKVCDVLEVSLYKLLFGNTDPHENSERLMEEIFQGEIRVTIHKVLKSSEK